MSKNRRRRTRRQQKQREKLYLYGGMGLVILIVVGIIAYMIFTRPPEVSAERLALDPVIGPSEADVTIYEYGAYGCESCRRSHQSGQVDRLLDLIQREPYQGRVNFVFVNFPVIKPSLDPRSAEAAQCALDQGNDAFWDFHNAIYDLSDRQYDEYDNNEEFIRLADEVGLDGDALGECLNNKTHRRTVDHHEERSRDARIQGTPTFMINGRTVNITDISSIEAILQQELGL